MKYDRIAELTNRDRRTVQRVLDQYLEGGVDAVREVNWHCPTSPLDEHRETIKSDFEKHPPQTITNDGYNNSTTVCELLQKIADLKLTTPVTCLLHMMRTRTECLWFGTRRSPVPICLLLFHFVKSV